jgi:hypothetical protein
MTSSPTYVVMFPADDEAAWEAGSDADHQVTYDTDGEFIALLKERGGAVTGGAELARRDTVRTLTRGDGGAPVVTDGPYAESVEQLSGFYMVTCDDYDALVEAARVLLKVHPVVEIRPVVS